MDQNALLRVLLMKYDMMVRGESGPRRDLHDLDDDANRYLQIAAVEVQH